MIHDGNYSKKLSICWMVIIAALLSACTVPTKVLLVNASTQDIVIEYVDEYGESIKKIVRVNERAESVTLLEGKFSISRNFLILEYSPDGFPQEFVQNSGLAPFHSRIVKTQLEKDGCIYLVPKNAEYPVPNQGVQPAGFPLCPSSTSSQQRG